jgi:hypothetical protein
MKVLEKVSETQLITIHDLDFKSTSGPLLARLKELPPDQELVSRYAASYPWLMYKSTKKSTSPPDTERFTFPPGAGPNGSSGSILIHPQYGVGVLTQWSKPADRSVDPFDLKRNPEEWREKSGAVLQRLELDKYTTELEREYPFLAITIDPDAGDFERYTKEHAEEIGRLFTGV